MSLADMRLKEIQKQIDDQISNTICGLLDRIKSEREFKIVFYIFQQNDAEFLGKFISVVQNNYPQYNEVMKKLLLFI